MKLIVAFLLLASISICSSELRPLRRRNYPNDSWARKIVLANGDEDAGTRGNGQGHSQGNGGVNGQGQGSDLGHSQENNIDDGSSEVTETDTLVNCAESFDWNEKVTAEKLLKLMARVRGVIEDTKDEFESHKDLVDAVADLSNLRLNETVSQHIDLLDKFRELTKLVRDETECPFTLLEIAMAGFVHTGVEGFVDDLCDETYRELKAFGQHYGTPQEAYEAADLAVVDKMAGHLRSDMKCIVQDMNRLHEMLKELIVSSEKLTVRNAILGVASVTGFANILRIEWINLDKSDAIIKGFVQHLKQNPRPENTRSIGGLLEQLRSLLEQES